jgi:hypothetical protein
MVSDDRGEHEQLVIYKTLKRHSQLIMFRIEVTQTHVASISFTFCEGIRFHEEWLASGEMNWAHIQSTGFEHRLLFGGRYAV